MRRQSVNMVWLKKSNPRRLASAIDDKKAAPGYPLEMYGCDTASCCHSRMFLSACPPFWTECGRWGIQNGALHRLDGIDVALSGYPLKTCLHAEVRRFGTQACGYDKKGVCFSEVLGSGILQDDYVVETRSTCPIPFAQVGRRAKYEMMFVWRHLTHVAPSISDFLRISSLGFGILQHNA